MILITGCSKNIIIQDQISKKQSIDILIYKSGHVSRKGTIKKDDKLFKELLVWAKNNNNGWSLSYVSYVPQTYLSSKGWSLNFMKSIVVLNCKEGQYTKNITPKDYKLIKDLNEVASPNSDTAAAESE